MTVAAVPDVPQTGERCSGCGEYRPHVLGRLCLHCGRAAVARWSPAMGPTIATWSTYLLETLMPGRGDVERDRPAYPE